MKQQPQFTKDDLLSILADNCPHKAQSPDGFEYCDRKYLSRCKELDKWSCPTTCPLVVNASTTCDGTKCKLIQRKVKQYLSNGN